MNIEELKYQWLLLKVLLFGKTKKVFNNPDKDLKSLFVEDLEFDLSKGKIPIYTTKNVYWKGAIKEMLWFLKGEGDILDLAKNKVRIWDKWAYKYYLENTPIFNREFKDHTEFVNFLVENDIEYKIPIPYTDFTNWQPYEEFEGINQIDWVCQNIIKDPDRKHYVVSAWNPTRLYQMAIEESVVIAACHWAHVINVVDGVINMHLQIRSNDLFLGNPFNVCQYAVLLRMYSEITGFKPGKLHVTITDAHIYSNQIAQVKKQIFKWPSKFPTLEINPREYRSIMDFTFEDFTVVGYRPGESIKADVVLAGGYNKCTE